MSDDLSGATAAAPTPRLRPDVTVEPGPADTVRLHDPAQKLRVQIDADMACLIRHLDGARTPAEIVAALAAEGVRTTVAGVDQGLGVLDGMFVLDNERGRARAEAARTAPPPRDAAPPTVLRVLADDRFDCHACGFCCSNGQNFGPVSEADRARVTAHDWAGEIAGVRGPEDLFEEVADAPGEPGKIYLKQRAGKCIFLSDDNLCRIHAKLGYAAKPHVCREFPFSGARTPEGTFVFTRRECKSLERSRVAGTPVADQLEAIGRIMAEDPDPIVVDALVSWAGPVAIPYSLARAVQRAALHALEAPFLTVLDVGLPGRILSIRDLIAGVSARLGERPGEAEIAAADLFAQGRTSGPGLSLPADAGEGPARESRQALAAILAEAADSAMKAGLYLRHEVDCGAIRRDQQESYAVALLELLAFLNPLLPKRLASIPPFNAAARVKIPLVEAEEVFRNALRQEVHGWIVVARTPMLYGFALLPLRHIIAVAHARRVAAARGASALSPDDAHAGILVATRLLATPANQAIALRDPRRLLTFFRGLRRGDPLL